MFFSRWSMDKLPRPFADEEGAGDRWCRGDACRRAESSRNVVGRGRHDRVRAKQSDGPVAHIFGRWADAAADDTRKRREHASISASIAWGLGGTLHRQF